MTSRDKLSDLDASQIFKQQRLVKIITIYSQGLPPERKNNKMDPIDTTRVQRYRTETKATL